MSDDSRRNAFWAYLLTAYVAIGFATTTKALQGDMKSAAAIAGYGVFAALVGSLASFLIWWSYTEMGRRTIRKVGGMLP